MNRIALVVALGISALAVTAPANAQKANVWVAPGLALANSKHLGASMGLIGGIAFQSRPHYATARGVFLVGEGDDVIGEIGLLYGRTAPTTPARATIGAGVSLVTFDACPGDDDPCFVPGVPVIAEFAFNTKLAGIGVQTFTNINAKSMYVGVGAFLKFGWMP